MEIQKFIVYLHNTKKTSGNTELSYERDLRKMMFYFEKEQHIQNLSQITETNLNSYMLYLERNHFAPSTVSRSVASMRAFFQYLVKEHKIDCDPSEHLKPPKVEKKLPEILTIEELDLLLAQPDENTKKGMRDKAMLELLYATGIRVSELIHLRVEDVNLLMGYINCRDQGKERIIPFGNTAKKAIQKYLNCVREQIVQNTDCSYLFTNVSGKVMSRQGFWKIIKGYANAAGIEKDITPQTLRHSFAAHLIQNGADLQSVQEMMGYADISMTQVYQNLNTYRVREVYAKAHPRK